MFSHVAAGDAWYHQLIALFLLVMTALSWHLRPEAVGRPHDAAREDRPGLTDGRVRAARPG